MWCLAGEKREATEGSTLCGLVAGLFTVRAGLSTWLASEAGSVCVLWPMTRMGDSAVCDAVIAMAVLLLATVEGVRVLYLPAPARDDDIMLGSRVLLPLRAEKDEE